MNTDEKYGRLRCISMGEEGSYLYGPQPFEFIAADSIDVNATIVEIEANVSTGGGGASSITSGTKDTLPEGTGSIPSGLMMKMQSNRSEIGITSPTQASAKERITTRSKEKLRKRLYAIRDKSNNKSQFDSIIEKIEARLAGTNGATKNTIITPKPLSKAGQIVMSVAEEGAVCDPPVATVTIEKECPIGEPTDRMIKFNKSNFELRRFVDGPGCDRSEHPGGYAFGDGSDKQMWNFYEGTIYATNFNVLIDWSICFKNMPPTAVQIDCNLSNVDSSNAQKVLDELILGCKVADELKIPIPWIYFEYIPVCAIEAHELSHVEDLQAAFVSYFDEIVKRINKIEPLRDWCKLSPTELFLAKLHKFGEAGAIQQEIYERIKKEIDDNNKFESDTETKADKAEIAKIKQIIDEIKLKFNIQ
jgi:hypothetical protein